MRDLTTQISQNSTNTVDDLSDIFSNSKKRTLVDLGAAAAANFGFVSDGDENDPKVINCGNAATVVVHSDQVVMKQAIRKMKVPPKLVPVNPDEFTGSSKEKTLATLIQNQL